MNNTPIATSDSRACRKPRRVLTGVFQARERNSFGYGADISPRLPGGE